MDSFSLYQSVMGRTEYEALRNFYTMSWRERPDPPVYARRVYITRRSFNLNDHFFRGELERSKTESPAEAMRLEHLRRNTFLTSSALLAYIPQWTKQYIRTKVFPPLLVVDELIIFGREVSSLMHTLETLVQSVWQTEMDAPLSADDKWDIHNAIISAIDIFVYATNDRSLLLEDWLKSKLNTMCSMSGSQWREYVQNVSRLINADDEIENTSYLPSFTFDKRKGCFHKLRRRMSSEGWLGRGKFEDTQWTYRGSVMSIWQRNAFRNDSEGHLHLTVRFRWLSGMRVRLVPLPIFGAIEESRMPELFSGVAQRLPQHGNSLASLMKYSEKLLDQVKLQLISCIISIIQFFDLFPQDSTMPPYTHDLLKIAQNFGILDDVYTDFQMILADSLLRQDLKQFLYPFLRKHTKALYGLSDSRHRSITLHKDRYFRHAEKYFYQVGTRDENYILQLHEEQGIYNIWMQQTMYVRLENYLNSYERRFINPCAFSDKISTLLPMMDQGIVSMNMDCYGIILKVSEQSKFCKVRQMYRFMPALIELERHCLRQGGNPLDFIVRFGQYLDKATPGRNYTDLFKNFVCYDIYCYHQTLRDWDIDLVSGLDRPNRELNIRTLQEWSDQEWGAEWDYIDSFESDIQYLNWERENQKKYKQAAIDFCTMERISQKRQFP